MLCYFVVAFLCPNSPNKVFPYLKTTNLSKDEKERLFARLNMESGNMQDEFALLVDRTRESLERQKKACSDLVVLVSHSKNNKLVRLFEESTSITELFKKLCSCWSFFNYKFLEVIIKGHCSDLKIELSKYITSFKKYCKRRICEVPVNVFNSNAKVEHKLYVKCDKKFDKNTLEDVEELECQLSHLLETELYLLGIEEGCLKLIFNDLCTIATPLSPKQVDELQRLGILRLYNESFDTGMLDLSTEIPEHYPQIKIHKAVVNFLYIIL